mmetsp:Transcript_20002/g.25773  ORF Transcript_20002/g.25773 Transcript_20002/m.25773 type:complete len:345 (-) Transcript_20002:153-1187(-)|eukprot:CAMPEP_0198150352 /NCGR_PEP_ID=MMETSP1443-20131203/50516_1 /TAXON_ID=186043 /ORGANISM="Entomoneis sp., Strain CCMP2396" /LENGTH=344 /DNA_ID=CAMNT_0043815631 /DNA_START=8 /DNA_END=1045 /DNA_ORIENTATION=-
MEFASEGFDLDALAAADDRSKADDNVVYEIGGGASELKSSTPSPPLETNNTTSNNKDNNPKELSVEDKKNNDAMNEADEYKNQGNEAFKEQNWLEAIDMYTAAIKAAPGMKGLELLKLRQDWRDKERVRARLALQKQEEEERRNKKKKNEEVGKETNSSNDNITNDNEEEPPETTTKATQQQQQTDGADEPIQFQPPPHKHGEKVAIYHCNRSAAHIHLERYKEAVQDCDVALLWHPTYVKALVRRSKAYESLEQYDLALADAQKALQLDTSPTNRHQYQTTIKRLEKLEQERMDTLKEETMDKLKDLGNSILGNFGLSMNNFKSVQDPNTGSYSISFDQNASK